MPDVLAGLEGLDELRAFEIQILDEESMPPGAIEQFNETVKNICPKLEVLNGKLIDDAYTTWGVRFVAKRSVGDGVASADVAVLDLRESGLSVVLAEAFAPFEAIETLFLPDDNIAVDELLKLKDVLPKLIDLNVGVADGDAERVMAALPTLKVTHCAML